MNQEPAEQETVSEENKIENKNTDSDHDSRYQEGEILSFVRVRFPGNSRSFPFLVGRNKISYGQKVVAMSDRGMAVGYVNSFPYQMKFTKDMLPIKTISKIATDEDLEKEITNYKKQKEFEVVCQDLIEKHELNMNLTHVELTQFGKKVVFYFNAPARVDFRGLVRDLVSELKLRIELRQISVRDRAAAIGNIGPCGRELCCSSFLSKYGNSHIKMAKNQNLTINFSKLNGVCGQLKCCLKYEDEVYTTKRKKLPPEGKMVLTFSGHKGRVEKLHLLSEQFDMICEDGTIRRFVAEQNKEILKDFKLPEKFDHISMETSVVIGLDELNKKREQKHQKELQWAKNRGIEFADKALIETVEESEILSDFIDHNDLKNRLKEESKKHQQSHSSTVEKTEHVLKVTNQEESTETKTADNESLEKQPHSKKPYHKKRPRKHKGNFKKKNYKKRED